MNQYSGKYCLKNSFSSRFHIQTVFALSLSFLPSLPSAKLQFDDDFGMILEKWSSNCIHCKFYCTLYHEPFVPISMKDDFKCIAYGCSISSAFNNNLNVDIVNGNKGLLLLLFLRNFERQQWKVERLNLFPWLKYSLNFYSLRFDQIYHISHTNIWNELIQVSSQCALLIYTLNELFWCTLGLILSIVF